MRPDPATASRRQPRDRCHFRHYRQYDERTGSPFSSAYSVERGSASSVVWSPSGKQSCDSQLRILILYLYGTHIGVSWQRPIRIDSAWLAQLEPMDAAKAQQEAYLWGEEVVDHDVAPAELED